MLRPRTKMMLFAGVVLFAGAVVAGAVGGFTGPIFGLATAPNGDLLIADAGVGIESIRKQRVGRTIDLPRVTDVSPIGRNSIWATTGGQDPVVDSGQAIYRVSMGRTRLVVNLFDFEAANNPDGHDPFDSNPFDVQSLGGREALVVDAGGNDLLRVTNVGDVDVLAVFPDELVSTANIKSGQ